MLNRCYYLFASYIYLLYILYIKCMQKLIGTRERFRTVSFGCVGLIPLWSLAVPRHSAPQPSEYDDKLLRVEPVNSRGDEPSGIETINVPPYRASISSICCVNVSSRRCKMSVEKTRVSIMQIYAARLQRTKWNGICGVIYKYKHVT